jgi:hypothetical protein
MPTKLQIHLAKVHRRNKGRTQANFPSRALLLTAGLAPGTITAAQRLFGQMSTGRLPEELALASPEEREEVLDAVSRGACRAQGDGGGSALERQRSVPMFHHPVLVTRTPLPRPCGLALSPADAPPSLPTLATGWAAPPFAAACPRVCAARLRHQSPGRQPGRPSAARWRGRHARQGQTGAD